jgi:hypothetical protein
MTSTDRRPVLRIYVAPGCAGCATALTYAAHLRQVRPGYPVEVVDLADHPNLALPVGVVGTPAYTLDDTVICLGNPAWDGLLHHLDNPADTRSRPGRGQSQQRKSR